MTDFVPTLPLAHYTHGTPSQKASFCEGLFSALTQTGFVILTDHGIELDRLTATYQTVETFFTQAEAEKLEFMVGMDGQRGYTPFGREHAKDNPFPDLKEFWHVGREEIRPNIWPSRPASFQRDVTWLYDALDKAGLSVLEALTTSLHLPKDYFEEMAMGGNSILRLLHYPPLADDADPACVRAAAHEDINLITLLVAASASGLELLDRDGKWRAINAPPNAIIADAGDMLARITNGAIPATTHRVVNPDGPNLSRYSMPFFLHPKPDALLQCLPQYKNGEEKNDILARDFLKERLTEIGLT